MHWPSRERWKEAPFQCGWTRFLRPCQQGVFRQLSSYVPVRVSKEAFDWPGRTDVVHANSNLRTSQRIAKGQQGTRFHLWGPTRVHMRDITCGGFRRRCDNGPQKDVTSPHHVGAVDALQPAEGRRFAVPIGLFVWRPRHGTSRGPLFRAAEMLGWRMMASPVATPSGHLSVGPTTGKETLAVAREWPV